MNLLEMSFAASILIVVIIIFRALLLNHLPKLTFPILWGIVLLRLLFPFAFDTEFSLNAFLLPPIIREIQPLVDEASVVEILPTNSENNIINSQLPSHSQGVSIEGETNANLQDVEATNVLETALDFVMINWIVLAWIVGVVLCAIFFGLDYWKSYQKIKYAIPVESEFFDHWKKEQGLKRSLQILLSSRIMTPLAIGIFKPKIVLPAGMDFQDKSKLQYILAHEFCHIKRLDALWKLLAVGVACLHWFNPLIWIAFVLANRDLEISCDAWVVKKFGKHTKKTYAYALISMVEYQNKFTPFYSNFARHAIKERLESIMNGKKATCFSVGIAILFICVLTVNAFAMPITEAETETGTIIEVSIEGMTFKVGDISLGERDFLMIGYDPFPEESLSAEEASTLLAHAIYEDFDISVDGAIFDIFPRIIYLDDRDESMRMAWSGFIRSDHLIDNGNMRDALFNFDICVTTGEILTILHNYDGNRFQ